MAGTDGIISRERAGSCGICGEAFKLGDIVTNFGECGHCTHETCAKHHAAVIGVSLDELECPACKAMAMQSSAAAPAVGSAGAEAASPGLSSGATTDGSELVERTSSSPSTEAPSTEAPAGQVAPPTAAPAATAPAAVPTDASTHPIGGLALAGNSSKAVSKQKARPTAGKVARKPACKAAAKTANKSTGKAARKKIGKAPRSKASRKATGKGLEAGAAEGAVADAANAGAAKVAAEGKAAALAKASLKKSRLHKALLEKARAALDKASASAASARSACEAAIEAADKQLTCSACGEKVSAMACRLTGKARPGEGRTWRCNACSSIITGLHRDKAYSKLAALTPARQMEFFKTVRGKGIKAARAQYSVFWKVENSYEVLTDEREQFEPISFWENLGYDGKLIKEEATDADVRHNVPMKGTCYRVTQTIFKKMQGQRSVKGEELRAGKKAGGSILKAAKKLSRAERAVLLAEGKLAKLGNEEDPEAEAGDSEAAIDSDNSDDDSDSSDDSSDTGDGKTGANAKKKAAAKKAKKERKAKQKAQKKARKLLEQERERKRKDKAAEREKAAAKRRELMQEAKEKKAADAAKASLQKFAISTMPKVETAVNGLSAIKCDASALTDQWPACCAVLLGYIGASLSEPCAEHVCLARVPRLGIHSCA